MNCTRIPGGPTGLALFFTVFVPFALAHFLSLLLRNANAVLAPFLVGSLALDAGQLGMLTSAFFLAVVLAQLPVGAAIDRHGSRKALLVLLLIAAGGTLLFARGESFFELMLARSLMGFGVGGTLLAGVKGIAPWMPPAKLPSLHGYLIAAGGLGAATATLPVRLVLDYTDWRGLFVLLAALTALAAMLIWFGTPRHQHRRPAPAQPLLPSLLAVLRHPKFRGVTALVLVSHTIFLGLQGLWVGRWLTDIGQLSESAVAYLLYLTMAAVIFGAIGVGFVTEWAGRRGVTPLDVGACGVGLFVLIQVAMAVGYVPSFPLLAVLFALVGTITGIEYTIVAQSMPPELGSRASACLNMLIFLGACLVQGGFGQVIALWPPDAAGHYPAPAYSTGFAILVVLQLPCLAWYAWQAWARTRPRVAQETLAEAVLPLDVHPVRVAARG
ncbi:MFS transporter [Massilia sp. PAMC28688]|uniref:MFS transporter n=1 Tax=Massilia sp. PAMC28688 TaxID=2861283 RepID=UPI001C634B67|nr:MFS transporter [Massilia sp. PAMC28688]QYF95787.1 MFS transporter [Massilia sp. PAMC28688]